tara:strand:- start:3740 stop:3889 length:150 start_codon:yes stop_codon:yes gene_type:complete
MKRWKIEKLPDLEDKVAHTKAWSHEKTDSKTIAMLIRFGHKHLFGEEKS